MIKDVTIEKTEFNQPPARFEAGTPNIADAVGNKRNMFVKNLGFGNHFSFGYGEYTVTDTSRIHCRNWFSCDTAAKNVGELSQMGLPKLRTVESFDFNDLLNLDYEFYKKQTVYWNTLFKYHKENPEDDLGSEMAGFNTAGFPGEVFSVTSGLSLENRIWDERIQNLLGFKLHYMKSEISKPVYTALNVPDLESNDYPIPAHRSGGISD